MECLNCSAPTNEEFCASCSQKMKQMMEIEDEKTQGTIAVNRNMLTQYSQVSGIIDDGDNIGEMVRDSSDDTKFFLVMKVSVIIIILVIIFNFIF